MPSESNNEKYKTQIAELEKERSEHKFELEGARALLKQEQRQRQLYQSIADFTSFLFRFNGLHGQPNCEVRRNRPTPCLRTRPDKIQRVFVALVGSSRG